MVELPVKAGTAVPDSVDPARIEQIVDKHVGRRGGLIATLEEIQSEYGYLPEDTLRIVAARTGRSLVDVIGVASFYNLFSLKPRGRHLVSVCLGTACHVRGSHAILDEFEAQLGVGVGETTADDEFTLKTVNCLGACALGPVVVIDGRYYSKVGKTRVKAMVEGTLRQADEWPAVSGGTLVPVDVSCPFCNHSLMDESFFIEGRPSIKVTISFGDKHGWLRLSSIYGRYNVFSEHDVPLRTVTNFFCPHCHSELVSSWTCAMCDVQMVQLLVRGGGTVRFCPRRGCSGHDSHMLDLA